MNTCGVSHLTVILKILREAQNDGYDGRSVSPPALLHPSCHAELQEASWEIKGELLELAMQELQR